MTIKCCKNCVAPKRHLACWGDCKEYLAEKAQEDQKNAQYKLKRKVSSDIYNQRADRIAKAMKRHGRR